MGTKNYGNVNLYELLGIELESDQAAIRKAYRKKALECHPDKNPDNPKAAELFHELSKALEILTDITARAAYDKVLKAKKASELRDQHLDSKRRKLKADLEDRERLAAQNHKASQPYSTVPKTDEEILKDEIERLRREGSKLLEEEQRLMREQLQQSWKENQASKVVFDSAQHQIRIKWKAEKNDPLNGGYTEGKLVNFLKKYGEIAGLVMAKRGSAFVEFKTKEASEMAIAYEKGLLENPLHIEWLKKPEQKHNEAETKNVTTTTRDYEDLVMRKLRQAEERKRLIEEMQKQDAE